MCLSSTPPGFAVWRMNPLLSPLSSLVPVPKALAPPTPQPSRALEGDGLAGTGEALVLAWIQECGTHPISTISHGLRGLRPLVWKVSRHLNVGRFRGKIPQRYDLCGMISR